MNQTKQRPSHGLVFEESLSAHSRCVMEMAGCGEKVER